MPSEELTASQENYLESILVISRENGHAHVKEIADKMDVRMASVTGVLRSLTSTGLVNYKPYGTVTLTDAGRGIAREVWRRHELLKRFLVLILGADPEVAEDNACRMEHAMDQEMLARMSKYVEFVEGCPLKACTWQAQEGSFCGKADGPDECVSRLQKAVEEIRTGGGQNKPVCL